VTHHASKKFWHFYKQLPRGIGRLADRSFKLLKQNPRHPSLHFKNVGRFWSVRVGIHHRALAIQDGEAIVWFWIGHHTEYDQILGGR
jgi:hypothetical protein